MLKLWRNPEGRAFGYIKQLVDLVELAISELLQGVRAIVLKKNYTHHLRAVVSYEEQADELRRKVGEELAKGTLPPLSREDFMRLIERVDMAADSAKDVVRCLEVIPKLRASKRFFNKLLSLLNTSAQCIACLKGVVKLMEEDFERALRLCEEVEQLEKLADSQMLDCLFELGKCRLDFTSTLLWERVVEYAERITDACEDASDMVEYIVIRMKG